MYRLVHFADDKEQGRRIHMSWRDIFPSLFYTEGVRGVHKFTKIYNMCVSLYVIQFFLNIVTVFRKIHYVDINYSRFINYF